ncbi:hypothetical protein [Candidatus Albibeggiatoa sp. nov. NOAA]|uniref:Ig-like domain-containing protein n=1 Tax=Candidatus Albibeggiatoa sp. nov. NOAA TaxID=3162724 RepID=UPI00330199A0|nr:hypothetical protein [Thiotrichaceae bacterium]
MQRQVAFLGQLLLLLICWQTAYADIGVVSGGNQTITIGSRSTNIIFKVADAAGNPRTGVVMQFSMLTPLGTPTTQGLSVTLAPVSNNAEAFTSLTEVGSIATGTYTIFGSLVGQPTESGFTTVNVISKAANSNIAIASGAQQTIKAGQPSQPIVYQVADSFGNPVTGINVNFSLIDPTGQIAADALTVTQADVNTEGQITTQIKAQATQTLGSYALIAQLTNDSTKSINTTMSIVAADVDNLVAVSAKDQNLAVNTESNTITFKAADSFGNAIRDEVVNFVVTTPSGQADPNLLTVQSATTDTQGLVSTQLKATSVLGSYQITATLASDTTKTDTVNIIVTDSNTGIYVLTGYFDTLVAGSKPDNISFKVINANGTLANNVGVVFYLYDANGQLLTDGILNPNAITDSLGEVTLQLAPLNNDGVYTIRAALASDANINITLPLNIIAAEAARLNVVEGAGQVLPAGRTAKPIIFEVSDVYGNTVTGKTVNFSVTNSAGNVLANSVDPSHGVTNANGQITVQFNANTLQDTYVLSGKLASNEDIKTSTNIFITEPLPALPSLGFMGMIDALGQFSLNKQASVHGGVSVNGGAFTAENAQLSDDEADIQAYINVAPNHVGQVADILVVVGITPSFPEDAAETYFTYNTPQRLDAWIPGNALTAFQTGVTLTDVELVKVFKGNFAGQTGILRVAVGYRLSNGTIVYNGENLISLLVY